MIARFHETNVLLDLAEGAGHETWGNTKVILMALLQQPHMGFRW